ncbi:unnamed protein product [Brachionus calyciflorus]|uniref:Deltamethrin resistance protein prag01 domain-containing protein n=1 Tax=Brachionus calyciflorus TaxID=104777 RepID=A0A813LVZ5_9BILA|nr:unnamed protein product [Brachionus calyciflorus]
MASRIVKSTLLQRIKNIKGQRRNYGGDHLTRLEVDLVNRNTMDLLPQAKGSWQELNNKRQAVNNAWLGFGTLLFLSAIFGTISIGYWEDAYFKPPYEQVRSEFPGAKYAQ